MEAAASVCIKVRGNWGLTNGPPWAWIRRGVLEHLKLKIGQDDVGGIMDP